MKKQIVFVRKISRSGKNLTKIITVPMSIRDLVEYGKKYKVTLEEIKNDNSKRS